MNHDVVEALRQFSQPTTPEELSRRGVQRLRSVSLGRVGEMMELAIERSLERRGLAFGPAPRGEVTEEARETFRRLLDTNDDLAQRRERMSALRAEIDRTTAASAAAREMAMDTKDDEHRTAEERIEILERRIKKLVAILRETEQSLEAALERYDDGLRSGLGRRDGPDEDDPRHDQKLEIMRGLYDLNRTAPRPRAHSTR